MRNDVQAIARNIEKDFGGKIDVLIDDGYPPVINDEKLFEKLRNAAEGLEFVCMENPHMTAEDFACYQKEVPGLMFNVGLGVHTELHANNFDFEEDALLPAANVFLKLFDASC